MLQAEIDNFIDFISDPANFTENQNTMRYWEDVFFNKLTSAERQHIAESLTDIKISTALVDFIHIHTMSERITNNIKEGIGEACGKGAINKFLDEVRKETYKPIPTGYKDIDAALGGGFYKKTIVLLGAAPGMGKTALASQILENMAKNNAEVLYINLEMSRSQLIARSLSRRCDMTALEILRGYEWTPAQEREVNQASEEYLRDVGDRFIYNPSGETQSAELEKIMEMLKTYAGLSKEAGKPAPIVCIDYLHLITSEKKEDAQALLKRVMAELKQFAIEYDTTVFAIMANNRESNRSGAANIDNGRDSSAIEYGADVMLTLSYKLIEDGKKDEQGNEYTARSIADAVKKAKRNGGTIDRKFNEVCLSVVKNRFGESFRKTDLYFDGAHSKFMQIDKAESWKQAEFQSYDDDDNPFI